VAAKSWDAIHTTTPELLAGGMGVWRGLFTPADLDALERRCDGLVLEQAQLTGNGVNCSASRDADHARIAQVTGDLSDRAGVSVAPR
jgi:hypothetical protein